MSTVTFRKMTEKEFEAFSLQSQKDYRDDKIKANGYTEEEAKKIAEESFEKWGKEEILSDVVLMIRKFRPDVIVTRFPPDKRGGHGHHTASAMLAIEAFEKAASKEITTVADKEEVERYIRKLKRRLN